MNSQMKKEGSAIQRSAYFWNSLCGILSSFQSVFMLILISHICLVEDAGIFSLGFANANLFLNVGKYGMRNYQVSDLTDGHSFAEYFGSRIITTGAMAALGCGYVAWAALNVGYSEKKTIAVVLLLLFKMIDSIEDVFQGEYQKSGRLDLGSKLLALRMASSLILFGVVIVLCGNLQLALGVTTSYSALFLLFEIAYMSRKYDIPAAVPHVSHINPKHSIRLLWECLPLFLSSFLMFYIGNAPKYAIDAQMDDVTQAYYGYIAMPVFVVSLLSSFIYNPQLLNISRAWGRRNLQMFSKYFIRFSLIVVVITMLCDICALALGIPVLNLLYNANLAEFLPDLLILITGGGLMALASLFTIGLTVIRRQRLLVGGYCLVSLGSLITANSIVGLFGIRGASWLYFGSMSALSLYFLLRFVFAIRAIGPHCSQVKY